MKKNNPHTHLYIVLGILVFLAAVFFTYNYYQNQAISEYVAPPAYTPPRNENNLERTVTLTPEQQASKQAALNDPALQKKVTLTAEESWKKQELMKAQEKISTNPN